MIKITNFSDEVTISVDLSLSIGNLLKKVSTSRTVLMRSGNEQKHTWPFDSPGKPKNFIKFAEGRSNIKGKRSYYRLKYKFDWSII